MGLNKNFKYRILNGTRNRLSARLGTLVLIGF